MNRRTLVPVGLAIVSTGLYLKWDALTAAGLAPLILAVLPCVAMCALGLCMRGASGRSCNMSAGSGDMSGGKQPDAEMRQRRQA